MTVSQTPIVRNVTAEQAPYRGLAFSQMGILKSYMQTAQLNVYSRIVTLANGVVITCKVCFNREDIHIYVPPLAPFNEEVSEVSMDHLLLFDGREIWGLDWDRGELAYRADFPSAGALREGPAASKCLIDDTGALLTAENGEVSSKAQTFGTKSCHLIYSNAVISSTNDFALTTQAGTMPLMSALTDRDVAAITQMGTVPHIVSTDQEFTWNATKTYNATSIGLPNGPATAQHRWAPRVFYPELGNPAPLPPARGLFYGKHLPLGDGGFILTHTPATKIKTIFGGYFDDRHIDKTNNVGAQNQVRAGYCETVTEMTFEEDDNGYGVDEYKVRYMTCFFIDNLWEPPLNTFYSRPALPAVGYKFVQSNHQNDIPMERFMIDYIDYLTDYPVVHWWSAIGKPYADTEPPIPQENRYPLHGILAVDGPETEGKKWVLHSWRGYLKYFAHGEDYVGHSVSTNGEIVAVFTGAGAIETVTIFNLKTGAKINTIKTTVRNFSSGVIIPTAPLDPEIVTVELPASPFDYADNTSDGSGSALGGLIQIPTGGSHAPPYVKIWKTIIDKRSAIAAVFDDPCWENSQVTMVYPASFDREILEHGTFSCMIDGVEHRTEFGWAVFSQMLAYTLWGQVDLSETGGIHNEVGIALWSVTGAGETLKAFPSAVRVVAGENITVATAKRSETVYLGFTDNATDVLSPTYGNNLTAPIEWTTIEPLASLNNSYRGTIYQEGDPVEIPRFAELVGCEYIGMETFPGVLEFTDACGLTGRYEWAVPVNMDPLDVVGPVTGVTVGSHFYGSGGIAPYAVSITSGALDSDGYITTVGCEGVAVVRVVDFCGTIAEQEVSFAVIPLPSIGGIITNVVAGTQYSATGGTAPISWDVSGSTPYTVSEDTRTLTLGTISCPVGGGAYAVISITDACGYTDAETVLFQAGAWVQKAFYATIQSGGGSCQASGGGYCYGIGTVVSGHLRYTTVYTTNPYNPDIKPECFSPLFGYSSGDPSHYPAGPMGSAVCAGVGMPAGIGTEGWCGGAYYYVTAAEHTVELWQC